MKIQGRGERGSSSPLRRDCISEIREILCYLKNSILFILNGFILKNKQSNQVKILPINNLLLRSFFLQLLLWNWINTKG